MKDSANYIPLLGEKESGIWTELKNSEQKKSYTNKCKADKSWIETNFIDHSFIRVNLQTK